MVARFSTLVEAEVACSALRGAGFHAEILERALASIHWTYQTALGGLRVAVPASELQDAAGYLAAISRGWRRPRPHPRDKGVVWRLLALLAGMMLAPDAGWLVIGARDRAAKGSALSLWGVVLVSAALTLVLYLALTVLGLLIHPQNSSY